MKSKAERLVRADPKGIVDASGYTPPDALDADVKTGMRPISPRAFRKGGKVKGMDAHHHAGRKPRKAGGRALTPDSMINRNAKEANEERAGEKHVGALKHGGAAHRKHRSKGGDAIEELLKRNPPPPPKNVPLPPPRPNNIDKVPEERYMDPHELGTDRAKRGGKIHKMGGGPLSGDFYGNVLRPNKQAKGGKVEHDDEAMDKALIKKMVKPSARTGKAKGGMADDITGTRPTGGRTARAEGGKMVASMPASLHGRGNSHVEIHKTKDDLQPYVVKHFREGKHVPDLDAGYTSRKEAKEMAEHGSRNQWQGDTSMRGEPPKRRAPDYDKPVGDYPHGEHDYKRGGRTARAAGGRMGKAKGKTNVNIIIGQHPPGAPAGGGMPMPPAPRPSMPVPMPPPPNGGMQGPPGAPGAPGAPMPIPVPMGPPGGGMPPMGRARGGRTYPIHDGAGGGEGRLEKIKAYGMKPPKKG